MSDKITISVIKADVGGYVGHSSLHSDLLKAAEDRLSSAAEKRVLVDFHVTRCGDDLDLVMTHRYGVDSEKVHKLAWDTFVSCTEVAKGLKLYSAGQDLL